MNDMIISKFFLASPLLGATYALSLQYFYPNILISEADAPNIVSRISFLIMSKLLVYFLVALLFLIGLLIISYRKEKLSRTSMYMLWIIATTSLLYMGVFGLLLLVTVGIYTYYQHGRNLALINQWPGVPPHN